MKILVLNKSVILDQDSFGGAEVRLHQILTRWARWGHKVVLVTTKPNKWPLVNTQTEYKVLRFGVPLKRNYFSPIWLDMGAFTSLPIERPDVLYFASTPFPVSTPLMSRLLRWRLKLIAHIDHLPNKNEPSYGDSMITGILYRFNAALIKMLPKDLVITTVSKATYRDLHAIGFKNVIVTGNGVDHTLFKPMDIEPIPFSIFSYGLFYKRKGFHILLYALKRLVKDFPHVKLRIAGRGPEERTLHKIVSSLGLKRNVTFLGRLSNADLVLEINRSIVVCIPSLQEGFGLPALEAMACKKPVIASKVGGLRELISHGNTGLLFEPGNSQQLAELIALLFTDNSITQRIANAGFSYSLQFNWDIVAKKELETLCD